MTKATLFASSNNSDLPVNFAAINKLDATVDPGASNDSSQGYEAGSIWVNVTGGRVWTCKSAAVGAAVWLASGAAAGSFIAPAGSPATVTGGVASATNGDGSSVVLTGGAKNGTGANGAVRVESLLVRAQGAPAAKTVSATLTAAELLSGIITVTQGAGAPSAQQVPTGTAIQDALPADFAIGDSFDVSVINLGGASEVASLTVNTDVTIVGNAAIPVPASGVQSSGMFRFRKTADHVFVAYRIA